MKPEEALKELSYDSTAYGGKCTHEVRMVAVKALKKQVPMKPNNIKSIFDFSGRYYTTKGNCPVCNSEGLNKLDFYCNKCGQKLDWGEKMADKTRKTCIENDNGLCDRKGILIEEDDTCENHTKSWMDSLMEKFIRKSMR